MKRCEKSCLFLSDMSRRSFRLMSSGYYNSDEESDSSSVTNISYRENPVKYVVAALIHEPFVSSFKLHGRTLIPVVFVAHHSGFSRRRRGLARVSPKLRPPSRAMAFPGARRRPPPKASIGRKCLPHRFNRFKGIWCLVCCRICSWMIHKIPTLW